MLAPECLCIQRLLSVYQSKCLPVMGNWMRLLGWVTGSQDIWLNVVPGVCESSIWLVNGVKDMALPNVGARQTCWT